MSDEEHLIENLICYVHSVGWANVPDNVGSLAFHNVYKQIMTEGFVNGAVGFMTVCLKQRKNNNE